MNKHTFLYTALAALTLSACADGNDLTADYTNTMNSNTAAEQPIEFGTYVGKSGATRAGVEPTTGSIPTLDKLKASSGFGVFAYYTEHKTWGAADYDSPTAATEMAKLTAKPNWMYNERIFWNTATNAWEYYPLKFWPNDNLSADNAKAQGTTSSKVSFFAYAPYAGQDDDPSISDGDKSGTISGATTGIVAISEKNAVDNPWVDYVLDTKNNVDLLWGTAGASNYPTVAGGTSGVGIVKYENPASTWNDGLANVNIDITKPTTNTKIAFNFKHALAKVGGSLENGEDPLTKTGLQVQLDINNGDAITGGSKPAETVVTIKNVRIENENGSGSSATIDYTGEGTKDAADRIQRNASLDLATGIWTLGTTAEYTDIKHWITSPASDASDIAGNSATLRDCIAEPVATDWQTGSPAKQDIAALITYLNDKAAALKGGHTGGVLTTAQNVYKDETAPLVFIPGTQPTFKITVEYYIRTKDGKLENGYSESHQTISKNVAFTSPVELNKKYNIVMHLGLTDIRFTATVSNWSFDGDTNGDGVVDSGETPVEQTVNLPINVTSAP